MQREFLECMKRHVRFMWLVSFGIFLMIPTLCYALDSNLGDGDAGIKVNANDMVYDMDKNTIVFIGDVVVTRGDFRMESAKMKIFMKEDEKAKEKIAPPLKKMPLTGATSKKQAQTNVNAQSNNIERIEAYEDVTFDYGTQSGKSDSAVYEAGRGLLTMYGNPVVREGKNFIQGEIIRYYMNEKRSEIIGSEKKRVEAIFSNKN